jgi:hypothetical protein
MELASSLPRRQEPETGLYPESDQPVHILTEYSIHIHFNIIFPSTPTLKSGLPLKRLPTKMYEFISFLTRNTCPSYLIHLYSVQVS